MHSEPRFEPVDFVVDLAAALCGVLLLVLALDVAAQTSAGADALGPGDSVRITVYQHPDLTTETRVSEKGTLAVPLIGETRVNGLTADETAARIAQALSRGRFLLNPQVGVVVTQMRSRQVSVLGQVNKPGRYTLDTSMKLTDVIALAGGIGPLGDDTVTVMLTRSGKAEKLQVNLPQLFRDGKVDSLLVQNGDTIYVQRSPQFYIYGEVQRAGAYKLEPNMTVMQALSVGGGITLRGSDRRVRVRRPQADGTVREADVSLSDRVQPEDVIYVRESLF